MCSETSEAVGTIWEHAQKEFQKFLKIRITLLRGGAPNGKCHFRFPYFLNIPLRVLVLARLGLSLQLYKGGSDQEVKEADGE